MKKLFISLLFLFTLYFCFAQTELGYDAEKRYNMKGGGTYLITVSELNEETKLAEFPEHNWNNVIQGFDKDRSQCFVAIIYFKSQSAALKNYKALLRHYNNINPSFDEFIDYFDNAPGYISDIIISRKYNIPVYTYLTTLND